MVMKWDHLCPQCGRSAVEDNYYKTDEKTINCYRCGYYYIKRKNDFTASPIIFTEEKIEGKGIFFLRKKGGNYKVTIFNGKVSQEKIGDYQKEFFDSDSDQENSYLVT